MSPKLSRRVRIANEILMYLRSTKKYSNDIYLQDPIGIDKEGNEVTMENKLPDDKESVMDQVATQFQTLILQEKMKKVLKERERIVLELRYGLKDGDELTQREIADMLGISRSYVSRIEKKALKKLYDEMGD